MTIDFAMVSFSPPFDEVLLSLDRQPVNSGTDETPSHVRGRPVSVIDEARHDYIHHGALDREINIQRRNLVLSNEIRVRAPSRAVFAFQCGIVSAGSFSHC